VRAVNEQGLRLEQETGDAVDALESQQAGPQGIVGFLVETERGHGVLASFGGEAGAEAAVVNESAPSGGCQ
jgi:hypothetical protein